MVKHMIQNGHFFWRIFIVQNLKQEVNIMERIYESAR